MDNLASGPNSRLWESEILNVVRLGALSKIFFSLITYVFLFQGLKCFEAEFTVKKRQTFPEFLAIKQKLFRAQKRQSLKQNDKLQENKIFRLKIFLT